MRVADAPFRVAVGANACRCTRGFLSQPGDVPGCRDVADACLGRSACRHDLVTPCDQQHLAGAEGDRRYPVADPVEPIERPLFRDGIDSRNVQIGQQTLSPDLDPFFGR